MGEKIFLAFILGFHRLQYVVFLKDWERGWDPKEADCLTSSPLFKWLCRQIVQELIFFLRENLLPREIIGHFYLIFIFIWINFIWPCFLLSMCSDFHHTSDFNDVLSKGWILWTFGTGFLVLLLAEISLYPAESSSCWSVESGTQSTKYSDWQSTVFELFTVCYVSFAAFFQIKTLSTTCFITAK